MTPLHNAAPRLQAPPQKTGTAGRAWKIDLEAWRALTPGQPDSGICSWIVEAPWAHPVWHSYWIGAIHLRSVESLRAPVIYLPGATHEVMLYALDPMHTPTIEKQPRVLHPVNFVGQWIAESDEAAAAKIEGCVEDIIAGRLSPDTDFLKTWMQRFSDSNVKDGWKTLAGATLVGVSEGSLTVVGTGKTAMDVITDVAAGPRPPRKDMH